MKKDIKLFLIDYLVAVIIITIGSCISKTFLCGMICGAIYRFIIELIELYFKESEEEWNDKENNISKNRKGKNK